MRRAAGALLLLAAALLLSAAGENFPVPKEENQIFFVQRSLNSNTIVYTARLDGEGRLDARRPVDVFWRRFNDEGERKELSKLERSLAYGGRMGGHFVTGHVDAVGTIEAFEPRGADHYLRVKVPAGAGRYLIPKGSIAIDGASLTVAEAGEDSVGVWLIPHTLAVTNLHTRRVGDIVNLEFDVLGKYVERMLEARSGQAPAAPGTS